MNWDEGTGGDVSLRGRVTAQVPLAYESVSGERWAPGIETAGESIDRRGKAAPLCISIDPARPITAASRTGRCGSGGSA